MGRPLEETDPVTLYDVCVGDRIVPAMRIDGKWYQIVYFEIEPRSYIRASKPDKTLRRIGQAIEEGAWIND